MTNPLDVKTEELIALGAALAANCEPCLRYHVHRGAEAGCTPEAMRRAVEIAQVVKATPAHLLARLADRLLGSSLAPPRSETACAVFAGTQVGGPAGGCCTPSSDGRREDDRGSPVDHR